MTVYRIRDWPAHYENDRSRERDALSWCAVPNKQHGLGYARLVSLPDGPALYGAFVAVLLVASRQKRPRQGWLTQDGTESGEPYTAEDLALITRFPAAVIQAMLDAVSGPAIGWVETTERDTGGSRAGVGRESSPAVVTTQGKGMEGKEWKEGTNSAEPDAGSAPVNALRTKKTATPTPEPVPDRPTAPQTPSPPPVIAIPLIPRDGEYGVSPTELAEWQATFPGLDAKAELARIRLWCLDNPSRRKTAKGARRFITAWLARVQDRAGGPGPPGRRDRPVQHLDASPEDAAAWREHLSKEQRF